MENNTNIKLMNFLRKFIVYVVEFIGIITLFSAFPYNMKYINIHKFDLSSIYYISLSHSLSFFIGLLFVILGYALNKKLKYSRYVLMVILPFAILMNFLALHKLLNLIAILEIMIFITMLIDKKYYTKTTDPINLDKASVLSLVILFLILASTTIGIYQLKDQYKGINNIYQAFKKSFELLFLMDDSVIATKTVLGRIFLHSTILLNWLCILLISILLLKPIIYIPYITYKDKRKVRKLVSKYVDNPITYLALENDKKYFFSKSVDGVIAYTIASGVAVCCGDPICSKENIYILLTEFVMFCKDNGLDICFCQASDKYLNAFIQMNFEYVKYGDEAMFNLKTYELSGKKAAKVRYAIHHADKIGITVEEYIPNQKRDIKIEKDIMSVSNEWLSFKKSSELSFMLGGIGLENPMDKRYFLAYNDNHIMQGFVVFTPFSNKKGYHADVTRRRNDAPIGVMEKIIISAFKKMKEEGVEYGSLGLAPLANIINEDKKPTVVERVLDYIYENMNKFYGFKTLYHYKKDYGPTDWVTRYLIFYPKTFTPKIAYSIIKAQNPKGFKDYIFTAIKKIFLKDNFIKDNN